MPELTSAPYLKVDNYVFLKGKWRQSGGQWLKDALFKVVKADAFPYTRDYIIKQGEQGDIDLDNDLSLYPSEYDTLYEIGVGLNGNVKLFVKLPSDRYYYYLEENGVLATVDSTTTVGGLSEEDIPVVEPKRMREYTIRDMRDSIVYTIVNSSYKDEKAVLDLTVNRVKLKSVTGEEYNNVMANWNTLLANGVLRVIRYPREG